MPPTDPLRNLGVRTTTRGGELRVWSRSATSMDLVVFDSRDSSWVTAVRPMTKDASDIWSVTSSKLAAGARYAIRANGPKGKTHDFDPTRNLIDPYARGLARTADGEWRSYVQDDGFDWGDSERPRIGIDHTVPLPVRNTEMLHGALRQHYPAVRVDQA